MRSIQSLFPHLKDHCVYEEGGECQIVLMYNLHVHLDWTNQIKNVYMSCLNVDANSEINLIYMQ
jgi:hypothetical protein